MRRVYLLFVVIFMFCLSITFAQSPPLIKKIRITNGEWPPYLSEKLPHYGVASRIVTEAFATQGIEVEYGFFPWARALNIAQIGQWDGAAVWLQSKEREKYFYYSDPVVQSYYVFFHLKSTPFDWNTVADLKKYRIGATLSYNYGQDFEAAEKSGLTTTERVPTDEQNFAKLIARRIDIFPLDLDVGYAMLHKNYSIEVVDTVTNHFKPLRVDPLYLLLTKKHPENKKIMVLFNKGLKILKESGKIDQYLEESRRIHP